MMESHEKFPVFSIYLWRKSCDSSNQVLKVLASNHPIISTLFKLSVDGKVVQNIVLIQCAFSIFIIMPNRSRNGIMVKKLGWVKLFFVIWKVFFEEEVD